MRFHNKVPMVELLEEVAIIGVLVAISIPIFTSQLEKAREATDLANIRSAYAECSSAVLTGAADDGVTYTATTKDKAGSASKEVKLVQTEDGWKTADPKCGGSDLSSLAVGKDKIVTVTVTDDRKAPTFTVK